MKKETVLETRLRSPFKEIWADSKAQSLDVNVPIFFSVLFEEKKSQNKKESFVFRGRAGREEAAGEDLLEADGKLFSQKRKIWKK